MKEKIFHWPTANIPIKFSLATTKRNTCRTERGLWLPLISPAEKKWARIKIKLEWKPYFHLIGWASTLPLNNVYSGLVLSKRKKKNYLLSPWASRRDSIHGEFCELSCFGQAHFQISLMWSVAPRQPPVSHKVETVLLKAGTVPCPAGSRLWVLITFEAR